MNLKTIFPKASNAFLKANETVLTAIADDIQRADRPANPVTPPTRRQMNATERGYAILLEAQRRASEVEDYHFEAVNLRISTRCFYRPDFLVERRNMKPLFCEVKGPFIREDARVKFLAARELHKWADFEMHQKTRDGWHRVL